MKKVKCAHVFGPVPKTTQGSSVSPFSGIGGGKQKYRPVPQKDKKGPTYSNQNATQAPLQPNRAKMATISFARSLLQENVT